MNRSFLFVPADSERKITKAFSSSADALILDLEDSVAAGARADARQIAAATVGKHDNIWVRINPLDSEDADLDLEAVMPGSPAGIVLPKPESAADTLELAARLDELERAHGVAEGKTLILPICTERPEALFALGGYIDVTERLAGLTWGAEDLSTAVGAAATRDAGGAWLPPYQLARSLCLFAAAAAAVAAIDTVFTNYRDQDGLKRYASDARRDGFSGMLAIHPAQVDVINDAFEPTLDEIERAERIIELFRDNPGAGTLGIDGEMIDRPHLTQAERIVELANAIKSKQ